MRFPVVVGVLVTLAACSPAPESKPIEIVNVTPPPASAKPAGLVVVQEPTPATPATTNDVIGPEIKARDMRKSVMQARRVPLLTTELDALERLLSATTKTAPDRPALVRRIAETSVEMSRALAAEGKSYDAARKRAIEAYVILENEYPKYPQRDEALYYLGLEYELAGDPKNSRRAFYNLIKDRPDSAFVAGAYFAFGEMFFKEAAQDPSKYDLAQQAYAETMKYPKGKNALFAAGLYRSGQVEAKKGDAARAAQFFDRLTREFPESAEAKLPR